MENNNNHIDDDRRRERSTESASTSGRFPPGYRFMPTDQELILEYLARKVNNQPIPVDEINEVELYKYSPVYLSGKYPQLGDQEWYFFTPRDRKYPNGSRPTRSVNGIGYWKATGADKLVMSKGELAGRKKVLVFYQGRPKSGNERKTNWIMHEYKLNSPSKSPGSNNMRLDDWVLCRIYEKIEKAPKRKPKDVNDEEDIVPSGPLHVVPFVEEEEEEDGDDDNSNDSNNNKGSNNVEDVQFPNNNNVFCEKQDHVLMMDRYQQPSFIHNQPLIPNPTPIDVSYLYGQNSLYYDPQHHLLSQQQQLMWDPRCQLPDFDWTFGSREDNNNNNNDLQPLPLDVEVNDSFSVDDYLRAVAADAEEGNSDDQHELGVGVCLPASYLNIDGRAGFSGSLTRSCRALRPRFPTTGRQELQLYEGLYVPVNSGVLGFVDLRQNRS
ncbi:NAC domain-containing protein 55 [Striga hermonthica]|uniref:NAC domain-containing protein 55 n=1 Tax=Striga hermonthica TaxID=68872 RepID=A0A9N7MR59_STRHE|nr:NAC domain-containing protein 55 [Striga hermonthica]